MDTSTSIKRQSSGAHVLEKDSDILARDAYHDHSTHIVIFSVFLYCLLGDYVSRAKQDRSSTTLRKHRSAYE
jgi:hypothetical protein